MNLIEIVKSIDNKKEKLRHDKDMKIKEVNDVYCKEKSDLDAALNVIMSLNTACLKYEGKRGWNDSTDPDRSEPRWISCNQCNGTGVKQS